MAQHLRKHLLRSRRIFADTMTIPARIIASGEIDILVEALPQALRQHEHRMAETVVKCGTQLVCFLQLVRPLGKSQHTKVSRIPRATGNFCYYNHFDFQSGQLSSPFVPLLLEGGVENVQLHSTACHTGQVHV